MPLIDQVQQDMVAAMKSRDEARLSALRMIKAALMKQKVDSPKPLDEAWDPDRPTLDVYLTIPEYRPDGFNVATTQRSESTR